MKSTGIVRKIDGLGRVVLPIELRRLMNLEDNASLEIFVDGDEIVLKKEEAFGPYFSLFPLELPVDDFNIRGAKYPLKNHFLRPSDSLCVSNEFAADEVEISFAYGMIVLMETRD